jgi:hypothetical protein
VTDVNTNTLAGSTERAKSIADVNIDLARVCLTRNDESGAEASLLGNELVEALDLGMVTVEDLEEGSLSTGGTLDTTETQVIAGTLEVTQIHEQILDPETSTLANGNQLGGLTVSETQAGKILVLLGELGQLVDDEGQLGDEDIETVAEKDQIGVVGTVARGSTPVDDTSGSGGHQTVGVDVGHNIVAAALLLLGGDGELVILNDLVGLHLLDSVGRDRKSELYSHDSVNLDIYIRCRPRLDVYAVPFSASASQVQSCLHVEKRLRGEKRYFIS